MRRSGGLGQQIEIQLLGDECSDYLNFVVKDASSNLWYDFYGDNFHVPLRLALSSMALDETTMDEEISIPDDQLPEIPQELSGIWAYIKWENDGCPNRSQQDADAEYQRGILVSTPAYDPAEVQGFSTARYLMGNVLVMNRRCGMPYDRA